MGAQIPPNFPLDSLTVCLLLLISVWGFDGPEVQSREVGLIFLTFFFACNSVLVFQSHLYREIK